MRYRDLFVDLDDTLWDIHRNGKECLEAIYVDYGYGKYYPEFEDYYNVYMRNNNRLWWLYREGVILKEELIVERVLASVWECCIEDAVYAKRLNDDFLERSTRNTGLAQPLCALMTTHLLRGIWRSLVRGFAE